MINFTCKIWKKFNQYKKEAKATGQHCPFHYNYDDLFEYAIEYGEN